VDADDIDREIDRVLLHLDEELAVNGPTDFDTGPPTVRINTLAVTPCASRPGCPTCGA